jgi:hypothetical protein
MQWVYVPVFEALLALAVVQWCGGGSLKQHSPRKRLSRASKPTGVTLGEEFDEYPGIN